MRTGNQGSRYWLRQSRVSRRRMLAGTGATGAALIAVACGGDGDDAPASGGSSGTIREASTAAAAATVAPEGKPGGEVRVAMDQDPVSLDTHIEASYRTQYVVQGAYNRLLDLSSDLVIGPELATSWEQPDPTTLTLKLRDGVKFHNVAPANGRVLTAEDVVWNINRIATNRPEFQRRYMFEDVTSVSAPDASTVVIKLRQPFAPLLAYLANPFNGMAAKEAAGDGDLRTKVLGTGPFLYTEGQKGVSYKLTKNPDYWQKDRPYLDGLTISIIPDAGSRIGALRAKQIDIENPEPDQAESFKNVSGFTYEESPQGGIDALRLVANRPPFNDPRVRRAIHLVMDRTQLIGLLTNGKANITGAIPFALADWSLSKDELSKAPGYRTEKDQDIAEAKQLLQAAGHADTEFVILFYAPPASNEQTAVVMQQQLQKAGLKARLDKKEYAAWVPLTINLDYQFTATSAGFRDNPDEYLYAPFHSKSSRNSTGYSSPEMDSMLERQRTQLNNEERKSTILEIQRKLLEEAPYAFIFNQPVFEVRTSTLQGYKPTYSSNRPRQFTQAWHNV
jgi:peptide/nickel transport system substrate-binding protein